MMKKRDAQGREGTLGLIKVGYDASMAMIDLDVPQLTPVHNPLSTVVYSASGRDVCMTMVRGKVLYEDGEFTTIDMEKIKNDTVQINGQWFLDPKVYHDSFDRSDKTAVLKTYLTAVCTLDADNIWKTILPATRLKIIAETENGDVASAKKEMLAAFSEIKEFQSVKDKLNDPAFINTMLALHEKNLIRINGNWYINLE